ncbi:MFS transporter [Rhizobium sp. CRIBSB]|nr:MFS transporter [Rhizobium sp. CRIBSB]
MARADSAPREWPTGWPLVLSATIGIAVAGMHYPVMGTLILPLTEAYGWTRGEVSLGLTIAALLAPLVNLLAGATVDRFGPRPVVLIGALVFGASYGLFAFAGPALWTWYAVSALFAVSSNFVGPIVWTMAVVRHFNANRGLALALSLSGSGVMASIMPSIVLSLLGIVELRGMFLVLALGSGLLMFIPAWFLFREPGSTEQSGATRKATAAGLPGLSVRQVLSGTRFWRLAMGLLVISATVGMFVLHLQPMLIDNGLTPVQAASAALMIGPAMITGRLGTGLLFDRLPAPVVAGAAFAVMTIACLCMLGFQGGMIAALAIAAVIGLGVGAELDVVAFLTSRYFGLRHYGLLFGGLMGVYAIGVGGGSAIAGAVFDRAGSYDPILMALGVGSALAALFAATLGRPDRLALEADDSAATSGTA